MASCNQFGGQEPGSRLKSKNLFNQVWRILSNVLKNWRNGPNCHPIYEDIIGDNGPLKGNIKWNFYKILVAKDGKPIERFWKHDFSSSKKLIKAIEEALEG